MERTIATLLRAGVMLSAAVVLAGGVWYLATAGSAVPAYARFHGGPRGVQSLGAVAGPRAVILLGLLILIATPVARVVFSLVAFALERDRSYVIITLAVLAILLYSIGTAWL
ncbi:MAG: DUF1634 domain-containing protein [Acidobacteriia bacterium]|nr:DUF1634 domain-containing protein [Terriglobia bacterium]